MMETDAVVVRVEGEYAWVRAEGAGSACGACSRKDGCRSSGTGSVLDGVQGKSTQLLQLANTIQARPGDGVVLCVADGVVLRAVWLAYGIPLLLALAGAMLALALTDNEFFAVVGVLSGLFGGYLFLRFTGFEFGRAEPILSMSFKRTPLSIYEA